MSVYKIDLSLSMKPFVTDLMNATGLAFDAEGVLYVSSRYDGIVYQVTPTGNMSVYVEGMGVATGIAFDREDNLYVGDRSGTIFKISRQRQIFVFATLEPSIAAYHLAFGPDDYLYVTGPTTSSFDSVHRISNDGQWKCSIAVLGRPQGMAFDEEGNLYVAASLGGRRGVVRISPDRNAELFLSGPGSWVWRLRRRSRWWWPPTTRSSEWTRASKAGRFRKARMPDAEIIAVGSEMLTPQRIDTNSLYLTDQLNALGVEVRRKLIVGDDRALLAVAVRQALEHAAIVILTGGLGPTEDDVTREAVADALGRPLVFQSGNLRCDRGALPAAPAQDGGDQQAPGLRDRRRRDSAERRDRAGPVD